MVARRVRSAPDPGKGWEEGGLRLLVKSLFWNDTTGAFNLWLRKSKIQPFERKRADLDVPLGKKRRRLHQAERRVHFSLPHVVKEIIYFLHNFRLSTIALISCFFEWRAHRQARTNAKRNA